MPHVQRVLIVDEENNVLSCHEFYGDSPEEAEEACEEFIAAAKPMKEAEKQDALIVGEVEEIGEDEIPETDEDEDEDGEEDGEILDAELVNDRE